MNISAAMEEGLGDRSFEQNLHITDALAITAWSEYGDDVAALWLCRKYRPLVAWVVNRKLPTELDRQLATDETLAAVLCILSERVGELHAARRFAQTAVEICNRRLMNRASGPQSHFPRN